MTVEITPKVYAALYRMLSEDAKIVLRNVFTLANGRTWFSLAWAERASEDENYQNIQALIALGLLTLPSGVEADDTESHFWQRDYHFTRLGYQFAKGLAALDAPEKSKR